MSVLERFMVANPGRLGAAFSRFLGVTETLPSKVITVQLEVQQEYT